MQEVEREKKQKSKKIKKSISECEFSNLGLSAGSRALKGAYRAALAAYRTAKAEAERYIEHPNGCISTKSAWSIYALRRSICASVPAALDIPFRALPETDRYAPFGCEINRNLKGAPIPTLPQNITNT